MLPGGTIYLKDNEYKSLAKSLQIDHAEALVGFEFSPKPRPVLQGIVVCTEFESVLSEV